MDTKPLMSVDINAASAAVISWAVPNIASALVQTGSTSAPNWWWWGPWRTADGLRFGASQPGWTLSRWSHRRPVLIPWLLCWNGLHWLEVAIYDLRTDLQLDLEAPACQSISVEFETPGSLGECSSRAYRRSVPWTANTGNNLERFLAKTVLGLYSGVTAMITNHVLKHLLLRDFGVKVRTFQAWAWFLFTSDVFY